MAGFLAALFLAVMDSVFLIRLWGYHTMEYMQGVFFLVGIGAVSLPCSLLLHGSNLRKPKFLKIGVTALVAGGILLVSIARQNRDAVNWVLARAPHTAMLIQTLSQYTDRDGDGFSSWFGFGDCDDSNPAIHPVAIDWPDNGTDENCFGGDLASLTHPYFTLPVKVSPPQRKNQPRPKIAVLVIVDTLRADKVDDRIGPDSRTPTLSRINEVGVRFTRSYSQSNNTLESIPFFFQLGFRALPWNHSEWTLAHLLKAGGVRTAGVFQASVAEWWGSLGLGARLFDFDEVHRPDPTVRNFTLEEMAERAVRALTERDPERDLFLTVHYEALHDSFTQRMEGGRMIEQGLNLGEIVRLLDIEKMIRAMENRYRGILLGIDRTLSPIWEKAKALESEADVMFIVTSDHGEEFYEHGGLFHMGTLYDETVRIPLTVYATGEPARQVHDPVGSYRVPSTILRFFGYGGKHVALLNLLRHPPQPFPVFSYFSWRSRGDRRVYMTVEGDWKMIYQTVSGKVELYNLAEDPKERDNRRGDPETAGVESSLRERMDLLLFYMIYGDQFAFQHHVPLSAGPAIQVVPDP
jgi:arylsulfatase A-like enzyme